MGMGGWGAPLSMTCCLTFGGGGVRRKPLGNTRPRKKKVERPVLDPQLCSSIRGGK